MAIPTDEEIEDELNTRLELELQRGGPDWTDQGRTVQQGQYLRVLMDVRAELRRPKKLILKGVWLGIQRQREYSPIEENN